MQQSFHNLVSSLLIVFVAGVDDDGVLFFVRVGLPKINHIMSVC